MSFLIWTFRPAHQTEAFHFCSALHEICMHCYFEYKACVLHLAGWLLIIWSHKYQILLIRANHSEFEDNEHLWKSGWFTYLSMNSDTRVCSDWKFFLKTLWAKDILSVQYFTCSCNSLFRWSRSVWKFVSIKKAP